MITITGPQAIELLEQAIEDKGPSFVYKQMSKTLPGQGPSHGCWYEKNGAPSCGVGAALHKAGVQLSVLQAMDNDAGDTGIDAVAPILEDLGKVTLDPDALAVFAKFQSLQDDEIPWGEALTKAKKEI